MPSDTESYANTRIRVDLLGILVFLCGATASINLNLIGEVYTAELLLIPLGLGVLLIRGDNGVLSSRSFLLFLLFGVVTLSGYMITDLVIGTRPEQYLRGWGRVGLLISNVLLLMIIVGQGRRYLWWFILGMGIGGVVYLAGIGLPWGMWKLGYGERVSLIVLALACVLPRRLSLLLLVTFAILNIALDYRNLAAAFMLVAGILWIRSSGAMDHVRGIKGYLAIALAAGLAVTVLAIGFSMTADEYGGRRADSNVGRLAGIIVAAKAIADSPLIGYGSWSENEEYARMLQEEKMRRLDRDRARRAPVYGVKVFRAHSQILQPWVEAGILGVAFFLYYAYRLVGAARIYILECPLDKMSAINLYFVILGAWHLVASPFGGDKRLLIAVVVSVIAALEFDIRSRRRNISKPVNVDSKSAIIKESSQGRILSRKKQAKNI